MNKKFYFFLLIFFFLTASAISGCTLNNPFLNSSSFVYSGSAEADEINITAEISGKIKDIKVEEGQKINSGDLIAVIDSSESLIKLEQADISLKNAQNELDKVNEGSRSEEIKAQEAAVSQVRAQVKQGEALLKEAEDNESLAKANLDYRQKLYDKTKALYDSGAETENALDNAKNALDNAKAAYEISVHAYEGAKAQLESLNSQLNAATQKLILLTDGAADTDKKTAQLGVELAKKNYDLLKLALDKNNIISPISGTIESLNYKQGEYVSPGSYIATLLDLKNIYVTIFVPEKVLPNISIGKEVSMQSDFLKGKTIKGKITYISSEAEFTPMNIVTKKDREKLVYKVKVKILDNLDLIKPGMLLDVNLK